jgi:hypothetical protein
MSYFNHSLPISAVYPGSRYSVEFALYCASGQGNYGISLTSSDQSLIYWQDSFSGRQGDWSEFKKYVSVNSYGVDLKLRFEDIDLTYMGTLSFLDSVRFSDAKDMVALGVLQVYPDWEMKRFTKQNRNEHRTKGGKLYSYTWGQYNRFEVPVEYVSNSKASIINSWWSTDALIYFKIYSGGVWEVNTCHLMNDSAPLPSLVRPYTNYRKGTLTLETF